MKLNVYSPYDSVISFQRMYSREMKTYIHKKFYIKLYKQNLFIANYQSKQKLETIEMSTNGRKNNYIYTVKFHAIVKRNELLIHGMTWINLKNMVIKPVTKEFMP